MSQINCPSCSSEMTVVNEPDMKFEICSSCEGVFLDEGELNQFATGLSGDIEYSSFGDEISSDDFPERSCSKCPSQKMNKVGLLIYSDIVFDHCDSCGGFFLDKGEIKEMNKRLLRVAGSSQHESREYIDDYLVRKDRLNTVGMGMGDSISDVVSLRISIYFKNPFDSDFRVFSEKWTDKISKAIGLFKQQDITIGDSDFDSSFIVQGGDEALIQKIFGNSIIQRKLLDFVGNKLKMFNETGAIEILNNRIVYTEGPYRETGSIDFEGKSVEMVEKLLQIAKQINEIAH